MRYDNKRVRLASTSNPDNLSHQFLFRIEGVDENVALVSLSVSVTTDQNVDFCLVWFGLVAFLFTFSPLYSKAVFSHSFLNPLFATEDTKGKLKEVQNTEFSTEREEDDIKGFFPFLQTPY